MDLEKIAEPEGWSEVRRRGRTRKKRNGKRTTTTRTMTTGTRTRKTDERRAGKNIDRFRAVDSWYHEKESAWLYRQVAAAEPDPHKQRPVRTAGRGRRRAGASLGTGRARSTAAGSAAPPRLFTPSLRARIVARLLRHLEPRAMRAVLAAMKLRGLSVYSAAPAAWPATRCRPRWRRSASRHRSSLGGTLRATVFGVNDGLVSNVSLVLGVAGAGAGNALRAHHRRRGTPGRRAVDGGRRIRLGALAARDVRISDRARARGARRVPARRRPRSWRSSTRRAAWSSTQAREVSQRAARAPRSRRSMCWPAKSSD